MSTPPPQRSFLARLPLRLLSIYALLAVVIILALRQQLWIMTLMLLILHWAFIEVLYLLWQQQCRDQDDARTVEALRASEERLVKLTREFETIFNGIPDSITLWSPRMELLWANLGTADYYQEDPAALLGRGCLDFCVGCQGESAECEVKRCFLSQGEEHGLKKSRDGRTWGIKAFAIKDEKGRVTQVIRLASDLTERFHLREASERSAHLAAMGELAAGVAHEINNPTGLILLELPILSAAFRDAQPILDAHYSREGDFPFAGMRYSEMRSQLPPMMTEIHDGARRIKTIVAELTDFSRPHAETPFVPLDLNEVVRKASSLVAGKIRPLTDHFTVLYAPQPVRVQGNFQRLEQVVVNLLINACQSLPDRSGRVTVTIFAVPARGRGIVTVQDSGLGIRPEHLAIITDPFFTTRREVGGTGLGLSVSARIVEEHRGTLLFSSEVGSGTLVTLELRTERSHGDE